MEAPLATWKDPHFRRTGIGSSDAAAICGLNRWKDPLSVYVEKMGLVETPEEAQAEPAYWGSKLEPIIAAHFAMEHGVPVLARNGAEMPVILLPGTSTIQVERAGPLAGYLATQRDPAWPIRFAHLDALALDANLIPVQGIEIKTAGAHMIPLEGWGDEGSDDVPDQYIIQVHHQALVFMGTVGALPWRIAALFGGQKYREYPIPIRRDLMAEIDAVERGFWRTHIEAGIAPKPEGYAGAEAVKAMFPRSADREIIAEPSAWMAPVRDYAAACIRYADADDAKANAAAAIQMEMGDAAKLVGDGWSITWKSTKDRETVDWEAVAREMAKDVGLTAEALGARIAARTVTRPGYRPFKKSPARDEAFQAAVLRHYFNG